MEEEPLSEALNDVIYEIDCIQTYIAQGKMFQAGFNLAELQQAIINWRRDELEKEKINVQVKDE